VGVGDIRAQTEQVIKNMRTILRAEGADLENLVKVTVFTTDMRYFDAISEVRRRHFTGNLPASTIVEVSKLAQPDLLIEIEGVAVL
jgi:enamine deaminase RidA (YjgF/YER057c/UK114 family)